MSSPSRSSPYSSYPSSSSASSSSSQTRAAPRSPRRSSGSETANRRVLADIDWWRVEDSQREVRGLAPHETLRHATPGAEDDDVDQEEREPSPSPSTPEPRESLWHSAPGGGLDALESLATNPFSFSFGDIDLSEPESPTSIDQFAALSINPMGRASLQRTMSSSSAFSDASDSSFSTPSLSPVGLSLGLADCVPTFAADSDDERDAPLPSLSRSPRRPPGAPRRMNTRSVSYSLIEDDLCDTRSRRSIFGAPSSRSSPFFSSTTDDADNFFL